MFPCLPRAFFLAQGFLASSNIPLPPPAVLILAQACFPFQHKSPTERLPAAGTMTHLRSRTLALRTRRRTPKRCGRTCRGGAILKSRPAEQQQTRGQRLTQRKTGAERQHQMLQNTLEGYWKRSRPKTGLGGKQYCRLAFPLSQQPEILASDICKCWMKLNQNCLRSRAPSHLPSRSRISFRTFLSVGCRAVKNYQALLSRSLHCVCH